MRCFAHPDREAVAICRMCGKGLCTECGESIGGGLACRGECVELGPDYDGLIREMLENYRKRMASQKELDEQRREGQAPSIKLPPKPAPTMSERAAVHRTIAAAPMRPPTSTISPFQRSIAILHLVVGFLLILWALVEPQRFFVVLLLGIIFAGFGAIQLAVHRKRNSATASTNTEKQST